MTGRFWWRALDAPSSDLSSSHAAGSASGAGQWHYPTRQGQRAKPNSQASMKLQVPRSDRRRLGSRRASRSISALAAAFVCAAFISAAATATVLSGKFEVAKITLGVSATAGQALMALGFGIDQVNLGGHHFTPDSDVYDALDLPNVKTFADFDAAAALKRIERLSWVDSAQITRIFPGSVSVQIRERIPAAVWLRGDKSYLIDATGRVLGLIPDASSWKLRQIAGEGANTEASMLFTALSSQPAIEQLYDHAERIAERRWSVVLKNGSRLELGADRDSEGLSLIQSHNDLKRALAGPPAVIDVRTPGHAVVRLVSAGHAANHAAGQAPTSVAVAP